MTLKLTEAEAQLATAGTQQYNMVRWGRPPLSLYVVSTILRYVKDPLNSVWIVGSEVADILKDANSLARKELGLNMNTECSEEPLCFGELFGMQALTGFPDVLSDVLLCVTFDENRRPLDHTGSWILTPAYEEKCRIARLGRPDEAR